MENSYEVEPDKARAVALLCFMHLCIVNLRTGRIDSQDEVDHREMPKRDALYMEAQREMIARAALECILQKGVGAATTREVCIQAGISKGALYAHFKTRDDLIIAAFFLETMIEFKPIGCWADYVQHFRTMMHSLKTDDRVRKLARALHEFVAEMNLIERAIPAVAEEWDRTYEIVRESLRDLQERDEISLPLGLEPTVQLHIQMYEGLIHCLLSDKRLDAVALADNFVAALAFTAGCDAQASATSSAPKLSLVGKSPKAPNR